MNISRRLFLFAAPAIVAAPSLMRVSAAALDVPRITVGLKPWLVAAEPVEQHILLTDQQAMVRVWSRRFLREAMKTCEFVEILRQSGSHVAGRGSIHSLAWPPFS